MFTKQFNKEHQEKYGFNTFNANSTNSLQILVMQSYCRVSCRKWLEKHPEIELPSLLKDHDNFQDEVTDSFGITSTVCAATIFSNDIMIAGTYANCNIQVISEF